MKSLLFPESALAHELLDGQRGLECGESAHNAFGLDTINVDVSGSMETTYKLEEIKLCGEAARVDVVAPGDKLPFADAEHDFVIASHVIEHFWNPIGAIREWLRVVRSGGYVFMIVPHVERTFDRGRALTPIGELLDRDAGRVADPGTDAHHSVWDTESFRAQMQGLSSSMDFTVSHVMDRDDKVGNGFTVVLRKC